MALPSDDLWLAIKRLEETTARLEKLILPLNPKIEELVLLRKDNRLLRKQVLELHDLLNEELKGLKPDLRTKAFRRSV